MDLESIILKLFLYYKDEILQKRPTRLKADISGATLWWSGKLPQPSCILSVGALASSKQFEIQVENHWPKGQSFQMERRELG